MPLPFPPTILLAIGGLLLAGRPWLRDVRWGASLWLVAWLYSAYSLAMYGSTLGDAAARAAVDSVWVVADVLAMSGQWLALALGLLFGVGSISLTAREGATPERLGFLSFLIAGVMLVVCANDAITLALSLEIVQFAVIALRRMELDARSHFIPHQVGEFRPSRDEATQWLGIAASLCVWLGLALAASVTASTQFDSMRLVLAQAYSPGPGRLGIGAGSKLGLLAIGLVVTGISSRMGLVPWQSILSENVRGVGYWTSGCVVLCSQLAGVLALARLCGTVWIGFAGELIVLLIVLSATTFAVAGGLTARSLSQGEGTLRRWLIALTMLHGAWLLIGALGATAELAAPENSLSAATGQPSALSLLVFSASASLLGLAGLFLLFNHLARGDRDIEYLDELFGLGELAPVTATGLMIVLASLIGHPPLWGCSGLWSMQVVGFHVRAVDTTGALSIAPHPGVIVLLIVATLSTLLSAAVVVQFARVLFLEAPISRMRPQGRRASLGAGLCVATVLAVVGLVPSQLLVVLTTRTYKPLPAAPQEGPLGKTTGSATANGVRPRLK